MAIDDILDRMAMEGQLEDNWEDEMEKLENFQLSQEDLWEEVDE